MAVGAVLLGASPASATSTVLPFDTIHEPPASSFDCTAIGMGDVILIRASFGSRLSGIRTFSAFFQAKPGRRFNSGQEMTVTVAGMEVGTAELQPIVGGDVASELEFNDARVFGDHTEPFPLDFPEVRRNTPIAVSTGGRAILSCRLE
jgi:hypothetical protein